MNCKPGDVAYLTQDLFMHCRGCGEKAPLVRAGTVVTVVRLGGPAWWLIAEPIPFHVRMSCGAETRDAITGFEDCLLRPFRADNVTQEEVRELYAPKLREVAHG